MSSKKSATKPSRKPKLKNRTWEYPTGSGIKIAEMPNTTGGRVFGVSYRVRIPAKLIGKPGQREMHQRKTKEEAEQLADDRHRALTRHGTEFSRIPATAQRQAALAWGILNEHNDRAGTALDLVEAVRAGILRLSPVGGRKTVADVVAELSASKGDRLAAGGLDASTHHDFNIRGARISKAFGTRFISDVSHTDIEEWLRGLAKSGAQFGGGLSSRSVRNYRNTLAEIFRHAKARQYCADNPFDRFTKETLKALGGINADRNLDGVTALSVDEAGRLLDAASKSTDQGMLGSTVLRLFCGIRTTEICRLDWKEIHWLEESPYVHIPASKAKKRRIRLIVIPENALSWLRLCNPPKTGPILPQSGDSKADVKLYCARFARVSQTAGITEWDSNDTRHSFGSYHYALHGDAIRTAGQMGHKQSDDMLFAHYRALVSKQDAEKYFALVPPAEAEKVTEFPKAASAS